MRVLRICAALAVLWGFVGMLRGQQSPAPSAKHPSSATRPPDYGGITNDVYHNNYFQFSYHLPYGWVDRTADMREGVDSEKSRVLLSVFERPPAARGDTVNSAVIIAAENSNSYAGLKTAADYLGPVAEMAESKGFKPVNEPYQFPIDGKPIVRRDFTRPMGDLTMHQSSLAIVARGYFLSFTFIGGNDDEIVELIEKLGFRKNFR